MASKSKKSTLKSIRTDMDKLNAKVEDLKKRALEIETDMRILEVEVATNLSIENDEKLLKQSNLCFNCKLCEQTFPKVFDLEKHTS